MSAFTYQKPPPFVYTRDGLETQMGRTVDEGGRIMRRKQKRKKGKRVEEYQEGLQRRGEGGRIRRRTL